ncbi:EAL domain-containing protein [Pseudoalteromonas sp. SSDWG2]|uniref:EAL domain-containing protein n=1 Tax=Pseudoalteromonas sp. SSDWG2 TaxID=3139391 RepID=UPI003BAD7720
MNDEIQECERLGCKHCEDLSNLGFDFTMAFQPIINAAHASVFGYEALVRGPNNESAFSIISQVHEGNRYVFDQLCRVKAIALAAKLGIKEMLSINFLPKAIYSPERCIRTTLEAAKKYNFPAENIMFEFTEVEKIEDTEHVERVVNYYKSLGFKTAIDDFGSGYAGLNLLADFQTNIVKFDMELVRNINNDKVRQAIFRNCLIMMKEIGITPLAEGIETQGEYEWLREQGVELMQGYLFAKPGFECLPVVNFEP